MQKLHVTHKLFRAAGITAAIVSALGVSAASAHQFGGGNSNTGPSSINRNDYTVTTSEVLDIVNRAVVDNLGTINARTGNNVANNNTTAGGIGGGDVSVSGGFSNDVNTTPYTISSGNGTDVSVDGSNDTTGPNSDNRNVVNVRSSRVTTILNDARLNNRINLTANTGGNTARNNTTVGNVRSGSVSANINMDNTANSGGGSIDVGGTSSTISSSGHNDTTGPNSRNTNQTNVNTTTTTTVTNRANVNNNLNVDAQTGNNTVSHNTTAGDVGSGDVNIDFSSTNRLN